MGGFYSSEFKCTNCDYSEILRTAPSRIMPINNNPKAVIMYRWCNNCSGIRSVFTGEEYKYSASSISNPDRESWMNGSDINQLTKEKETYEMRLEFLIEDKKNIKLNFMQKIFKNSYIKKFDTNIRATRNNIFEVEEKILKYIKSTETAVTLTKKAKEFYNSKNIVPKCLCCGSDDVASTHYSNENHICGGKIIERDLGRGGSTGSCIHLVYDQFGNSTASVTKLFENEIIEKLKKPYLI